MKYTFINFVGDLNDSGIKWRQVEKCPAKCDYFVRVPKTIYYSERPKGIKYKYDFVKKYEHFNLYRNRVAGYFLCFDDFDLNLIITAQYDLMRAEE